MTEEVQAADDQFPTLVYKGHGPHSRAGGTYDHKVVEDEVEFDAALTDGWFPSLPEAIEGKLDVQEVAQEPVEVEKQEQPQLESTELNPEPVIEPKHHGKKR